MVQEKSFTLTLLFLMIFLNTGVLFPQNSLYMPLNIKKAYEKGTRSNDGNPGPKYWQNKSEYKIYVSINPETRKLSGKENIKYFNNSPNVLNRLVIRLYQDINKYGNTRMRTLKKEALSDGVKIEKLNINGKKVDAFSQHRHGTNLFINLRKPLPSGKKLHLISNGVLQFRMVQT